MYVFIILPFLSLELEKDDHETEDDWCKKLNQCDLHVASEYPEIFHEEKLEMHQNFGETHPIDKFFPVPPDTITREEGAVRAR